MTRMPNEMTEEQLEVYQELLDLVVYTADSGFNTLYGEVIDLELPSKIRKAIRQIEDLMDYEMKPLIAKLEGLEREEDEIMNPLSLIQYREPPKSFAESIVVKIPIQTYYRDFDLRKEGKAMKENTYTISYKQKVKDEWVLVTKTGRSDSKEAKDIMRDLIAGEIPEEHLEVLLCSLEVGERLTKFIEGRRGVNE